MLGLLGASACAGVGVSSPTESSLSRQSSAVAHVFYAEPESPESRVASGTGFLVDESGLMVTAAHVIADGTLIDVRFGGFEGREGPFLPARVLTVDTERDVALLMIDAKSAADQGGGIALARRSPGIGAAVSVMGFPESNVVGAEMRRSTGAISALRLNPLNREDTETRMLELEAKIEPGNSGSPVFDSASRVIGVVSSRWETTDSYALAAPVEVIRSLMDERLEDDLEKLREELAEAPEAIEAEATEALALASAFEGLFEEGSEGADRVLALKEGMAQVGTLCEEVEGGRAEGALGTSWRQVQVMRHLMGVYRADVAALRSSQWALEQSGGR